jgi:hypothetical protein
MDLAMNDPAARALALVRGAIIALPNDPERRRVLQYVKDKLAEIQTDAQLDADRMMGR